MSTIKLFKEAIPEKIVDELVKTPGFFDMIDWNNTISDEDKEKLKSRIKFMYIQEIKNIQNDFYEEKEIADSIIVVHKMIHDSKVSYEASKFYKKDFDKVHEFDKEKPENFRNPTVDIIFSDRSSVLSTPCSKFCIDRYGLEVVLATILRQICFFGIDEEICEEAKEEVIKDLEEAAKQSETLKDEDYISEDELWKELEIEDNRSEEEKEADREQIRKECIADICEMIDVYTGAAKEAFYNAFSKKD